MIEYYARVRCIEVPIAETIMLAAEKEIVEAAVIGPNGSSRNRKSQIDIVRGLSSRFPALAIISIGVYGSTNERRFREAGSRFVLSTSAPLKELIYAVSLCSRGKLAQYIHDDAPRLMDNLSLFCTLEELKSMAYRLGIDYGDVPHSNKSSFARELVMKCERSGKLTDLQLAFDKYRNDRSGSG